MRTNKEFTSELQVHERHKEKTQNISRRVLLKQQNFKNVLRKVLLRTLRVQINVSFCKQELTTYL